MHAAPPRELATVAFQLPEHLHAPGGETPEWCKIQRPGALPSSFIEGPVFDKNGALWFCDIPYGRIFRHTAEQGVELVYRYEGEPNGLAVGPDGHIYITDYSEGLLRFEPGSNKLVKIMSGVAGSRFRGLNDLIFSKEGIIYFTDQGSTGLHDPAGRVYRLHPSGELDVVLDGIPSPNGLVLSPDEQTLFVAVTRDNSIWRVPLLRAGGIMKVGAFIRLSGGSGPDGLAMDAEGNLVVCHLGLGCAWVFNVYGEPIRRIDSPAGRLVTNATFSNDGAFLAITESETGSILNYAVDW